MVTADPRCPHVHHWAGSQMTLLGCIMAAWGNRGSPFGLILNNCGKDPASSPLVRHAVNIYNQMSRNKVVTRTSEDTKRHTHRTSLSCLVWFVSLCFPFPVDTSVGLWQSVLAAADVLRVHASVCFQTSFSHHLHRCVLWPSWFLSLLPSSVHQCPTSPSLKLTLTHLHICVYCSCCVNGTLMPPPLIHNQKLHKQDEVNNKKQPVKN